MANMKPKKKMANADKNALLKNMIAQINKDAGKTIIGIPADDPDILESLKIKFIPTPSLTFNDAVGGGIPRGRETLLSGDPDSGKTTLVLETIAKRQQEDPDFYALWLESENSLKASFIFDYLHMDPKRFIVMNYVPSKSKSAEDYLDDVKSMIETGMFDIVVINSLKMLVPENDYDKDMKEETVAAQARMNSKLVRRMTPKVAEAKCAFVVIEHLTTQIGVYSPGGTPKGIAGGQAIKYWSALTIQLKSEFLKSEDPIKPEDGKKISVTVKKNHCMPEKNPYCKFDYYVRWGIGIDEKAPSLALAVEKGIIEKHGAWLWWMHEGSEEPFRKFRSKAEYLEVMDSEPDTWKQLCDELSGEAPKIENLSEQEIAAIEKEEAAQKAAAAKIEAEIKTEDEKLLDDIEKEKVKTA